MRIPAPPLRDLIRRTIIVAYREDTAELERALRAEGLVPEVQRPTYTPEELRYSRTIRCLLNHAAAWRKAAETPGCTLVVEADFVPCRGLAAMPAPFDPARHGPLAWAFLYAGGPRLLDVSDAPFLQGHASCPVALLVSPGVAPHLVAFAERLVRETPDLAAYSQWDTIFQWYIMGSGARCYLPWRHYGEHGGLPNPEHNATSAGLVARLGLAGNHHAECLMGPLAFLPPYAHGSRWRFLRTRAVAKLVGLGRACTRRVVSPDQPMPAALRFRAHRLAFRRLLSLH